MATRRSKPRADEAARRVRHLLVLDATTLLARLTARRHEMVRLFSRHRDRGPLLAASHTLWPTVSFDSLAALPPGEQRAAVVFFELVGELRWYFNTTEDMPTQLAGTFERSLDRLKLGYEVLLATLGALETEGAPVVDGARGAEAPADLRPRRKPRARSRLASERSHS